MKAKLAIGVITGTVLLAVLVFANNFLRTTDLTSLEDVPAVSAQAITDTPASGTVQAEEETLISPTPTRVATPDVPAMIDELPTTLPTSRTTRPVPAIGSNPSLGDVIQVDARVVPQTSVELRFGERGTIVEWLVQEGDQVARGQVIGRLDSRDQQVRVAEAQASLAEAQAQLQRVQNRVTSEDIAAAQADLDRARIALEQLQSGPKEAEVREAASLVQRAQVNLQSTRDDLSKRKNTAQLELDIAADRLRTRQDAYSTIYWENRDLEQHGELEPEQRDREVAALREVEIAKAELDQTQLDFDQTRQAEITGIQEAETRVDEAQANLDQLLAPPDPDEIAAAQQDIAEAQARLAELTGGARAAEIESARSRVQQLAAQLERAQLAVDQLTLRTPISGTVAVTNVAAGEEVDSNTIALVIADVSRWLIETRDLVELDVVQIEEGAPVELTFDALPDLRLSGTVRVIKPLGTTDQSSDYATYTVVIDPDTQDTRLRWNMTAFAEIQTTP